MCGALAERVKFHGMVAFSVLWGTFVYCPIAHSIWGGGILSYPNGLLGGSIDFAGGSVVHISAGVSALVAALVLGSRLGLWKGPDATSQSDLHRNRSGNAVVRLVWIQRW